VLDPEYGTRCSTILLADDSGTTLLERRFDSAGVMSGQSAHHLPLGTSSESEHRLNSDGE
jgi:uncharacterized protein with NRDE domain